MRQTHWLVANQMNQKKEILKRLQKRGQVWHVRVKGRLKSTRCKILEDAVQVVHRSGVLEIEQAAKVTGVTEHALRSIGATSVTMADAIAMHLNRLSTCRSPKHARNAAIALRQWTAAQPVAKLHPSRVEEQHIDAFINDSTEVKSGTRKLRLSYLRQLMDYCREQGWTQRNPARIVDVNLRALSHVQKETRKVEPYSADEVSRILSRIKEEISYCTSIDTLTRLRFWLVAIEVSFLSGLRFGDVVCLEWASFKTDAIIHTGKTGARVTPSESDKIKAAIAGLNRDCPYLFPAERELYCDTTRRHFFSVWFNRLCAKLDLPYKGLHAFRHGRATDMAKRGEPTSIIALELGHTSETTTRRYIHT